MRISRVTFCDHHLTGGGHVRDIPATVGAGKRAAAVSRAVVGGAAGRGLRGGDDAAHSGAGRLVPVAGDGLPGGAGGSTVGTDAIRRRARERARRRASAACPAACRGGSGGAGRHRIGGRAETVRGRRALALPVAPLRYLVPAWRIDRLAARRSAAGTAVFHRGPVAVRAERAAGVAGVRRRPGRHERRVAAGGRFALVPAGAMGLGVSGAGRKIAFHAAGGCRAPVPGRAAGQGARS